MKALSKFISLSFTILMRLSCWEMLEKERNLVSVSWNSLQAVAKSATLVISKSVTQRREEWYIAFKKFMHDLHT